MAWHHGTGTSLYDYSTCAAPRAGWLEPAYSDGPDTCQQVTERYLSVSRPTLEPNLACERPLCSVSGPSMTSQFYSTILSAQRDDR
jgi:hypothetical protein